MLTTDLGILCVALGLFYMGIKTLGAGEKELMRMQYIQLISKWLFLSVLIVEIFEVSGMYGGFGAYTYVSSMTSNVPLNCAIIGVNALSAGQSIVNCGTTTEVVSNTYGNAPELGALFMICLMLWFVMLVYDMMMLLPTATNIITKRMKR